MGKLLNKSSNLQVLIPNYYNYSKKALSSKSKTLIIESFDTYLGQLDIRLIRSITMPEAG